MRAVFAALAANLGIAITKFVAFLLTGSASMLAESVHSVADTGNELLLIVGRGRSSRPASEEHPFGFGRERYFYGFVVSVMLFTVGAAFSVYDGIHKIVNPEPVRSPLVALIVLLLSAVLEGFSLRTGIREANQVRGSRNWGSFIRRSKAPELPVVLLEDTAALIGLAFAFAGVTLSALTGNGRWDGAGSLAIGLLLAAAAAILAVEMKSLLIGESASADVQRMIVAALEDGPGGVGVIHMRTVHISPDAILVAAKIAVRESDTGAQVAAGIDAAERRVRAAVPIAKVIYLEPDIYRPSQVDHTDPSISTVVRNRPPRRPRPAAPKDPQSLPTGRTIAQPRDSRRRARSFSKSRARPAGAGTRPSRRPRSATAARTGGSASTRRPNASDAGLMSKRRSSSSAAATASRSASLNCRCAAPVPGQAGARSRTTGSSPSSSR
jgi:cation diffusion facilitator family transporter